MSSNNLDEKVLLQYICGALTNCGIDYITKQTLKKAKENDSQSIKPLIRLLFDLVILHNFSYQFTIDQLGINAQEQQEEAIQIIIAHLFQIQSPFLIEIQSNQDGQKKVGIDLTSSRYLLIACGWMMAVSNFFNRIIDIIKKKYINIYTAKPLNLALLQKKFMAAAKLINLHEQSPKLERIAYLTKIFKSRKYSVECLMQKRDKILNRIRMELKSRNSKMSIQDLLGTTTTQQVQQLENQLRDRIVFEKDNVGYRKYWWIWLDIKIIPLEYKQLSQHFEQFQKLECPSERIKTNVQIDLNYLQNYFQTCGKYQTQMESINAKVEQMNLKAKKKFKEIDQDILYQIKNSQESNAEKDCSVPSFIGMQLKKYMNIDSKAAVPQPKSTKKGKDKLQTKLCEQIKEFIRQIDDIAFI